MSRSRRPEVSGDGTARQRSETELAVEAALLDSERDPNVEVRDALWAVVRFAVLECEHDSGKLRALMDEAIERVAREGL